ADDQYCPAVAFCGTNFLVVWHDWRGDDCDIYGARVTVGGVVLEPQGIVISTTVMEQLCPAVAFGGTNYLVVWHDSRGGDYDIYGARVTPAGTVLDPQGIAISSATDDQGYPAVAFDGSNYLVVWADWRTVSYSDVYGARVSPAGVVLDSQGIAISSAAYDQWYPDVAFDGTNYLVVWMDGRNGNDWDIYGARVSPGGTVSDERPVVRQEGRQLYPSLTRGASGQLFLVYQGWAGMVGGRAYNSYRIWGKLNPLTGIGGERSAPHALPTPPNATIVRGMLFLPASGVQRGASGVLIDIAGRELMELRAGWNDISRLAPGVYFVRGAEAGKQVNTVRKVIIQR
ncbi:MAG: hypothetical protein ABIK43_05525, partial [candidate division WOR-3 bacterium]